METLEVQVKSADEATAAAAKHLGVTAKDIKVKVLEESAGLFGKKKLKLQVERVEAKAAKPKTTSKAKASKEEPAEPVTEVKAKPTKSAKVSKVSTDASPVAKSRGKKAEVAEKTSPESEEPEVVATKKDAAAFIKMVEETLEVAGLDVTVKLQELQGRYVNLTLDGADVSHLVGKSGEVLNSFQYLMNLMAANKFNNGVRITLDGNDFRRRREEVLRDLATNVAAEVLKRGEEAVFDALPAFERRIVHKVLAEMDGIQTYSEGEEPNRHVVVAPAS
ncbi:MAG: KH domain-containing protein [Fimbriimonadaceae bacterium]|nr:KH domain-containing protein [Fimbriimonadaceae bacterium]